MNSPTGLAAGALTVSGNQTHFKGKSSEKSKLTHKMVLDLAKRYEVQYVNMQFTDLLGIPKAVTIPIHKLESALDRNVWFDGSSINGFTRIFESDMYLKPDISTFAVLPWTMTGRTTARIICDVYMPDGTPFVGDPRYLLRRQTERAAKMGYTFYTGPELEFFLFRKDNGRLTPLPHDQAGYFDQSMDLASEIRAEMSSALDFMGVEVECLHHEVAEGQHEIGFRYGDALRTADSATTLRMVLKAVANKYGLHATFMPKPIAGVNGSGMHVHQSLSYIKNDDSAFYDEKDSYHLSETARHFIGGQLRHIRALNCVLNPTVNSYKRLVIGHEAPVYVSWGTTNRSALIRIPRFTKGQKRAARAELRCPDPTANPYLAFAGMLAAGLDGIDNKIDPPPPMEEDIFGLGEKEIDRRKLKTVCETLHVAMQEMKHSELMKDVLGEHAFNKYYQIKKKEWDEFRLQVSDWEVNKYLEVY